MGTLVSEVNDAFRSGQKKEDRINKIEQLAARIDTAQWTSRDVLEALEKSSRFCERPELALHFFHGCSCNHDAFVYNDETLDNQEVLQRVERSMEEPVGQAEACELRQSLGEDTKGGRLAACASCNEYLVPAWGDTFETRTLSMTICKDTLYTPEELEELLSLPQAVRKHRMFVVDGGYYYHLNPELVHGDKVTLCTPCATTPRGSDQSKFSIANGYDPGLRRNLCPKPRRSTRRCIAALRVFKSAKLNVLDKERKGHVILFPCNAPPKVAARLPWTDEVLPTVTFYGAPTRWGGCSAHLDSHMTVDPDEVYSYLKVLKLLHVDYEMLPITVESVGRNELMACEVTVMQPSQETLFAGGHGGTDDVTDDSIVMIESAMIEPAASLDTVTEMVDGLLRKNEIKGDVSEGESRTLFMFSCMCPPRGDNEYHCTFVCTPSPHGVKIMYK